MSGAFCFSKDSIVTINSSGMVILDRLLKPAIRHKTTLYKKIYYHYDLYSGPIIFNDLTSDEFMDVFYAIQYAFEEELPNIDRFDDKIKKWAIDLWENEMKPAMQKASLYKP